MDREIHAGYRLFPGNYVAADMLRGDAALADKYTDAQKQTFLSYLQSRIDLVSLPDKDEDFLRERILTMYANPVFNKLSAQQ